MPIVTTTQGQMYVTGSRYAQILAAGMQVVDAGSNLSMARPVNAGPVYWRFAANTNVGAAGENIVNRQNGDLIYVADA